MADVLVQSVPISIAAALGVVPVLLVIVLLSTERPLPNAGAFCAGYFLAYLALGGLLLLLALDLHPDRDATTLGGALRVLLGGLILIFSIKRLVDQPDPDAAPPTWMTALRSAAPLRAFGVGLALAALNVMNLAIFVAALHFVFEAGELSSVERTISMVAIVGAMCFTLLIPIIIYLAVPDKDRVLETMRSALDRHGRTVTVAVFVLLGVFLVVKGMSVLI